MTIKAPLEFESEDQRYDYPLTKDSLVVDCGGFNGDFACRINEKYGCMVLVSEPVFHEKLYLRVYGNPYITIDPRAVGGIARKARFGVAGDSTGQFAVRDENVEVDVMHVSEFLKMAIGDFGRSEVDLLKLNIEGMEFEVLDHLCGTMDICCVKYLQVQFHQYANDLDGRIYHLVRRIQETHDLEWGSNPYLWMSFKRRCGIGYSDIICADPIPYSPTPINRFFDEVIVINLSRRMDRYRDFARELEIYGIGAKRIEGCDIREDGDAGCTWSHRKVLDIIASSSWNRVLVLEDDFKCVYEDVQERFGHMINLVPEDWDILYIGGHYADNPKRRINQHVIQANRMKTTSSYGITRDAARRLAPVVYGHGPVDELFSDFTEKNNAYIFQPRLMIQRPGYSDLQKVVMDNAGCMLDQNHENMV